MTDPAITSIRARLLRFHGSYPDICAKYGFQYSWLSKFARGERGKRPSFDLITKLAQALDEIEAAEAYASHTTDPTPPVRRSPVAAGEATETTKAVLNSATATH